MNLQKIKETLHLPEYAFLRDNEYLGNNIILLGLGGSHAYGTDNENSDLDIRGISTNTKYNILRGYDFEQVVEPDTDTTVYSFDKIVKLLCSCNPNTIEMLGLKPEHYLFLSDAGKQLLENKTMFLSRIAVHSFGGYANAQLRRLSNKAARLTSQSEQEENILKSISHAQVDFRRKYFHYDDADFKLYVDKTDRADYDSEIFADINLKHYPLRDFKDVTNEMNAVIKAYSQIGRRNEKAIAHDKLGKHMMHLVRLYLMCFDILEKGEINTYRDKDHDFLMGIRNGKYLDGNRQPTGDFYDLVNELEKRLDYDKDNTDLPENVDMKKIEDFVVSVNEKICCKKEN